MPREASRRQVSKSLYPANFWPSTPIASVMPVSKDESLIFVFLRRYNRYLKIVGRRVEARKLLVTDGDKKKPKGMKNQQRCSSKTLYIMMHEVLLL